MFAAGQLGEFERGQASPPPPALIDWARELFENSPDIILLIDRDSRILAISRGVVGPHAAEELIGRDAVETLPGDRARVRRLIGECLASGEIRELEHEVGNGVWVHARMVPIRGGGADRVMIIASEITARKRMEERLQRRTHELGQRVKELQCLFQVSALLQAPRLSLEEILAGTVALLPPACQYPDAACARITVDRREFVSAGFVRSRLRLAADIVVRNVTVGVVEVFYRGDAAIERDGVFLPEEKKLLDVVAERLAWAVERDWTERALQQSEAQFRNLVENINAVVFQLALEGTDQLRVTFLSPSIRDMTGCEVEELLADPSIWASLIHPDDWSGFVANPLNVVGAGGHVLRSYRVRRKGAEEYRWIEDRLSVVLGPDGRVVGLMGVGYDITDRKNAEQETRRLWDQLLHAQKMESIGTLAGGIAHDFNNLLMGILGNLSLIRMRDPDGVVFQDQLREIEACVHSAADLTKQLLGFARRGKYELAPVDLVRVAEGQATLLGRTRKQVIIRSRHAADLWPVRADRGQMEQVLMNLLLNAADAMPDGGVLSIETQNVELAQADARPLEVRAGRFVRLSVIDTGTGMPGKTMQRIFEPFFTTKGMGRGTGLGLATVFGIVRNHGGAVTVESEVGRGTAFEVYLPAGEEAATDVRSDVPDLRRGSETVLVVDDEEPVRRVCAAILSALGYEVLVAAGGADAVAVLHSHPGRIALVVLDTVMPGMSGVETLAQMRAIDPSLRVVLCSGYNIEPEMGEMVRAPGVVFLQKPFSLESLSEKLRQVLDHGR